MAEELSDDQVGQLQEIFDKFDNDKSGAIDAKELGGIMLKLGYEEKPEEIHQIILQADKSRDGMVDFEEFKAMMAPKMLGTTDVSKMFKVFDQKADGVITISELRATLDALGEKLSEEEIDEMMREADKTGDGRIDFHEFKALMT